MASTDLTGTGHNESVTVTGNKTLAGTDGGVIQNVTATATITLPAVTTALVGTHQLIRVGKEGITVTVNANASDSVAGNGFTAADGKGLVFTNQPAGSWVELVAGDATIGWHIGRILGTATRVA